MRPDCFGRALLVAPGSSCALCALYGRCCDQTTRNNSLVGVLRWPRHAKETEAAEPDTRPLVSKFDPETLDDVRTLMRALGFVEKRGHRWFRHLEGGRKAFLMFRFRRMADAAIEAETAFLPPRFALRFPGVLSARPLNPENGMGCRLVAKGVRSFQHIAAQVAQRFR